MPTWVWIFMAAFLVTAILAFLMSPPEALVNWFMAKFELHPQLRVEDAIVSVNGIDLADNDKKQFVDDWNHATVLERYYDSMPYDNGLPAVVTAKQGKRDVRLDLYVYHDHVDVVKHIGNKIVAYRLLARDLQKRLLAKYGRDVVTENRG